MSKSLNFSVLEFHMCKMSNKNSVHFKDLFRIKSMAQVGHLQRYGLKVTVFIISLKHYIYNFMSNYSSKSKKIRNTKVRNKYKIISARN